MPIETSHYRACADCLDYLANEPDDRFDMVFTSPPYEDARLYGIDFKLKGQEWVDWAFKRFMECYRVCKGLTAWVVEGKTKNFSWSAVPMLLGADLKRAGVGLRKPPAFARHGIMGSGGPDWWRNDYELVICASHGRLPWSRNAATGHPPKYKSGGVATNRRKDGTRVRAKKYACPEICNPGNIISGHVGKGHMGSDIAHETEAPFPEWLVESFIKCFCPPGGTVLDPFAGSGTVAAVCKRLGRNSFSIDIRPSQIDLIGKRLAEVEVTT
jgi:adenine-specific DNA-methyltransferase